jgi:anhydro-N-acetylmuramic acid kinase
VSDLALGIMSGTSADGIDAALVELDDAGRVADAVAHYHAPFDASLRERVLASAAGSPTRSTAQEIALLHAELGDRYADAA